ncbi:uncharacterized protein LOC133170343 [Syngnathus typhle]|uniref:uncharacterized protein LOC133170343 n=1 Tax=Syngnathus typhle TaxID=161592 RepID=UPI002A6B3A7A|nr:uncharacterized protein LOC133170343 [Syngnathus typhle]
MIKRSISSSGVLTCVFNFSTMWLAMAFATTDVVMETTPNMTVGCRDNVTLTCEANSAKLLNVKDVKLFSWNDPNNISICNTTVNTSMCRYEKDGSSHKLSVTILDIMPIHKGKYLCKLRSKPGTKSSATFITVQGCLGSQNYFVNNSMAKCKFNGVCSEGDVHWFEGDQKLNSSLEKLVDKYGCYDFMSGIEVQSGNHTYYCKLWISDLRRYASIQKVVTDLKNSFESKGEHPWICMLLCILVTLIVKV